VPAAGRDPDTVAGVPTSRPLEARSGDVTLAGTLWEPDGPALATVLMHPGSGPATRDNDVYFPELRPHLLAAGIATASFDKRGVGGSTGDWHDAGIAEQAADAGAALESLRAAGATEPIGLFGHSQGGWVVVEAAGQGAPIAFVVSNGGPGVPPSMQDRFALANAARHAGRSTAEVDRLLHRFDQLIALARHGATDAEARDQLGPLIDDALDPAAAAADEREWSLARLLLDHDPRPALRRIAVPVLALFGADDEITPVAVSVDAFREEVRPDLLTVAVVPGGDHRGQAGEPRRMVDGYVPTLVDFVLMAIGRREERP
jgi:pimeloyl-ACP methyl ester carboxylesterase